jgi:hypothetical protein
MAISVTYNKIIQIIRSFADRHGQVAEFQVGISPDDLDWDKKENGVVFLTNTTRVIPSNGQIEYFLETYILDMVNRGENLEDGIVPTIGNVHNDTMLIATDLVSFILGVGSGNSTDNCVGISEDITIDGRNIEIEPLQMYGRNLYAGVKVSYRILAPFDWDRASIPLDVTGGSPVPPTPVTAEFLIYVNNVLNQTLNLNVLENQTINIQP